MHRLEILPEFTLDDEMYNVAAEGISTFAPDLPDLTWEKFTTPADWLLIPDDRGELSKAEVELMIGVDRTIKLNIWFRPDVRGGAKVIPHNHRWESFTGHVLMGGYDEDRYWRSHIESLSGRADVHADLGITHAGPAANVVEQDTFHEVVGIHEPGRTMSLMVCGYGEFGNWTHLDIDSGRLMREQPVAGFNDMLAALNPHHPSYRPASA
jgi:hypothetical protein